MKRVIQPVNGFKTTDDRLFEVRQDAIDHQDNLNLKEALTDIIDEIYFHNIQPHEIVNGLMDRADEIRSVLTPK